MNINDLLPWLNLLLLPSVAFLINIDRRLTRMEALREADQRQRTEDNLYFHRRRNDAEQ